MTDSQAGDMILVYDLRRDHRSWEKILSGLDYQWQSYLRGETPVIIAEGRITDLFFAPYEGERMFRLDEGSRQSVWLRQGDESWYAVGRKARIEQVVFHILDPPEDLPVITRIWIGPLEG